MAWITDSLRGAINAASALNPFGRREQSGPVAGYGGFDHQLALAAYMSSGLLRKVIAVPAEDRVREWRDWQAEADDITKLEDEERRLALIAKVRHAEILRGIGGGALIVVAPGGHDQPLTAAMIRKGGIQAINVVSRWQITGDDWDDDLASATFGQPRMFKIDGKGGAQRIHPSRVICFRGDPIPASAAIAQEEAFWGDSKLLRVFREVQNADNAQAWFAALVRKAKLLRVGIPNITDYLVTEDGRQKLNSRVALIAEGESVLNAVVYDAGNGGTDGGGEKIDDYQVTWNGIPAMMDAFDQRVAAVADIPFTRLMGRSPGGMNATGTHDMDNWNKGVASSQRLELRPCLEHLDPFLLASAGVASDEVTWRFAPLDVPTEKVEADTFFTTMQAVEKLQATAAIPDVAMSKAIQNLMSEREWMPGMDQALSEIPEAERFGLSPDPADDDPSAITQSVSGVEGGDPRLAGGGEADALPRRRAANDGRPAVAADFGLPENL